VLRNGLHLAALCSVAIAQQYFEPLADGADFFIGRGATGLDVVVYAVGLVLLPPAVLLLLEGLAGVAGKRLRDGLHLLFVGGLAALIAWQALNGDEEPLPPVVAILVALVAGGAAAFAYHRVAAVSFAVSVLSPVPVMVLALFLFFSPVRALFGSGPEPKPRASSGTPVVMVVLDELPVASLMDRRRRIDGRRYPNFARFARHATWYRNAASVGDYTQVAAPALLTGRPGKTGRLQVVREYPDNLFTLLGGSYRLDVFEQVTDLCRAACPAQRRAPFSWRMRSILSTSIEQIPALPHAIRVRLADALHPGPSPNDVPAVGRRSVRNHVVAAQDVRFKRFLGTLGGRRRRSLSFLHLILPHRPWHYLPSGQKYVSRRSYSQSLFARWPRDPWPATVGYQRHLLQVEFVDRLIGRLVQRLTATGLYDRALIVVVADHGSSFRPDDEPRILSRTNVADVASVPLLLKAPGQRRGRIDDSYVESTDVLPLIARQLKLRLPWRTGARSRMKLTVYREQDGGSLVIDRRRLMRLRDAAVARKVRLFAGGDPFQIGPHRELVGAPLSTLTRTPRAPISATLDTPRQFRSVDPRAGKIPIDVSGVVRGGPARRRAIAVALNGRIAATGWTIVGGGGEHFTVLLPPGRLRRGPAVIEVYAIARGPGGLRLTRLVG
jgi:hypothetical protein